MRELPALQLDLMFRILARGNIRDQAAQAHLIVFVVMGRVRPRHHPSYLHARQDDGLTQRYAELFDKYVSHVGVWVKKEKVRNRVTGNYEDPDELMMGEVEGLLQV